MKPDSYTVIVTYGNVMKDQRYVSGTSHQNAKRMRDIARAKGFKDATVWKESEWQAYQKEKASRRASSAESS